MAAIVIKPGLLTTIQDLGRFGAQKYGVVVGGAMDTFASRIANVLVGNAVGEAVLEMTVIGPVIQFETDTLIAICGGDFNPVVEGREVPQWRAVFVRAGRTLTFSHATAGTRCYLAIGGGINVPERMGSRSTYVRASLGGYQGRALTAGDRLELRRPDRKLLSALAAGSGDMPFYPASPLVFQHLLPNYSHDPTIRVVEGVHYERFTEQSRQSLFLEPFKVTPQSDRMGYRLQGPELMLEEPMEMISESVTFGTVQVPPSGNPIVLMADRQTTGGYPKIAQVAAVDLPVMAQLAPGSTVRFSPIALAEAQLLLLQERHIRQLQRGILIHYRGR
ncbi:biotin-dependent carboxyltransferase family protein [Paenibacillaceae bacterium WGS1546]|uniref:5-oxoprolinase subunit C family protein n=1 Tax=Cohnella sp. WGS1546 TaxID=3366810 RepID=UPI00372D4184